MSRLRRIIASILLLLIAAAFATMAAFARPEPFFPYARSLGNITIHASEPIPAQADETLREITRRLDASPLGQDTGPLALFVAENGWRNQVYFTLAPGAGGTVFYPFTDHHGFLSGADFAKGLLTKNNRVIQAPRTLAYFGSHELAHVLIGRRIGMLRFHSLPGWVGEGLPDYIALGPADIVELDAVLGDREIKLSEMERYGSYPRYWMLVSWYLDHEGKSIDQLLATDMTEPEALQRMRTQLEAE